MGLTTDRNDPELGHGVDTEPIPQHSKYLVLSDEEIAKGFVRPVRTVYIHTGTTGPKYPTADLTPKQLEQYEGIFVKYEEYPEDVDGLGRYWTQEQLDNVGKGCGSRTTMNITIAETYAAKPYFYGATYCVNCQKHLPVGKDGEFVWEDGSKVGT